MLVVKFTVNYTNYRKVLQNMQEDAQKIIYTETKVSCVTIQDRSGYFAHAVWECRSTTKINKLCTMRVRCHNMSVTKIYTCLYNYDYI